MYLPRRWNVSDITFSDISDISVISDISDITHDITAGGGCDPVGV